MYVFDYVIFSEFWYIAPNTQMFIDDNDHIAAIKMFENVDWIQSKQFKIEMHTFNLTNNTWSGY